MKSQSLIFDGGGGGGGVLCFQVLYKSNDIDPLVTCFLIFKRYFSPILYDPPGTIITMNKILLIYV